MRILLETGIRFHSGKAIDTLRQNGINTEGDVAFFKEDQLIKWVEKAPKTVALYARNPVYDMQIGGDKVYPAPCYGAPSVIGPDGTIRSAIMKDYTDFAKLFHHNPVYKINGGVLVQPSDIPVEKSPQIMHYAALLSSDKCLMVSSGNHKALQTVINMTGELFDGTEGLPEKPRILTIVNTNSPLEYHAVMLDTLFIFAEYGQPIVIAAAAMAGTTAPITMAGAMALVNAEILSGIALTQMIRPGTPVIYASQTSNADMRNCFMAIGSPEGAMSYEVCALMAKYYGLPCRGGGALTDALTVGAQSGYESMMNYLVCCQSKINLIIHSAGIMNSYGAVSYEKLMCDFEIISMVDRFLNGMDFDADAVPFELIKSVGHGGEYMTSNHTLKHCREAAFEPKLSLRGNSKGYGQFSQNISEMLKNSLESYKRPDIDAHKLKALEVMLNKEGVDQELLDSIKSYI